jgi:serine/threonine protein kinase
MSSITSVSATQKRYEERYEKLKAIAKQKDLGNCIIHDDCTVEKNKHETQQRIPIAALEVIQAYALNIIQNTNMSKQVKVVFEVCNAIVNYTEAYFQKEPFAHKYFGELFYLWANVKDDKKLHERAHALIQYALDNHAHDEKYPDWEYACRRILGSIEMALKKYESARANLTIAYQYYERDEIANQLAFTLSQLAINSPREPLKFSTSSAFASEVNTLTSDLQKPGASLQDHLYAWNHFIRFTEFSYFTLRQEHKDRLFELLCQAEPLFKTAIEKRSHDTFILRALLSILVQKSHFLLQNHEKAKNKLEIRKFLKMFYEKSRGNIEDIKILDQIIQRPDIDRKANEKKNAVKKLYQKFRSITEKSLNDIQKIDACIAKVAKKLKAIFKDVKSSKDAEAKSVAVIDTYKKKYSTSKELHILIQKLLEAIERTFCAFLEANLAQHGLTHEDAFCLSVFVERGFLLSDFPGLQCDMEQGRYIKIKKNQHANIPRSLIINPDKSFTVLSKLHGDLKKKELVLGEMKSQYIAGGIKKVSAAITMKREENKTVAEQKVAPVNKDGMEFDSKAINYLFEFQGVRGLTAIDSYIEYEKEVDGTTVFKQLFVQDRADGGDFADFIASFIKNPNLKQWKQIFSVLEDVAHGLSYMHKRGLIHWDIKLANVLLFSGPSKNNELGSLGKLNDFDATFEVGIGEQPHWLFPGYGTHTYRAPEFSFETKEAEILTSKQGKQRDMYAFGCMLLDIVEGLNPTHQDPVYIQVADKKISPDEIEKRIYRLQQNINLSPEEEVTYLAYHLIHPNPERRLDVFDLIKNIAEATNRLFKLDK